MVFCPVPGPSLPEEKLVVAVNWYGVSFQEGKERMYLKLSYPEVMGVQMVRSVCVLFIYLLIYFANGKLVYSFPIEIHGWEFEFQVGSLFSSNTWLDPVPVCFSPQRGSAEGGGVSLHAER